MKSSRLRQLFQFFIHCLCPNRCACCSKVIYFDEEVCPECENKAKELTEILCEKCHSPLHLCRCSHGKVTNIPCISAFPYTANVQQGILTLKQSATHGIPYFAKAMAKVIQQEYKINFDGIVYVPITNAKKQLRGYNQCELLAKAIGKELGIPVIPNGLVRLFDTVELHKHKGETINRKGCVFGVFDACEELVREKTLLLIDDVVTTGATINECAKMLQLYDATALYAATIATRHLQLVKTKE